MTKEVLMSTGVFSDNDYLDKYLKIVNTKTSCENLTQRVQKHHIVPRFYFKHRGLQVDNSSDNLAILSRSDHILAHYYLCLCLSETRSLIAATFAFISMTNESPDLFDTNKLDYYESIYSDWCAYNSYMASTRTRGATSASTKLKISESNTGRYKGHIWIHKDNQNKHIDPVFLEDYMLKGWLIGRNDPAAYKKISDSQKAHPNRSMLGKKQSVKQKLTVSARLKGVKKSDEAKHNMCLARLNKILVSNEYTGESKYIHVDEIDTYLLNNFHRGRLRNRSVKH